MTTRQYLETLVVCNRISNETFKSMENMYDTKVDIKDFCNRMLKLYDDREEKEDKLNLILYTLKQLMDDLNVEDENKQKLVREFTDIAKCHKEYLGNISSANIADIFRNDAIKYQICKNDLRFLRVVDIHNMISKNNGKKRKYGYTISTDMLNDITINGRSYEYKAIFIKDGKEEKVRAARLEDCNKIIHRVLRDDYDIVLMAISASKFAILTMLNLSEITDEEFMELLKIISLWDFDSDTVNSNKYFKLSEGNIGIRYILGEMVKSHIDINDILDFCWELKEKLKNIKINQRMNYIKEIAKIVQFRNENVQFRYVGNTYGKLSQEIKKIKDIRKLIDKLKIGIADEIRNITVDGKEIYFNEKSCMIANMHGDNELAFKGLLFVDKDRQVTIVRNRYDMDKLEKGDYLFRVSFNFEN